MENKLKESLLKLEQATIEAAQIITEGQELYEFSDDPIPDYVAIRETVMNAFIKAVADAWGISSEEAYAYMLHTAIHDSNEEGRNADGIIY